jgi:hypothetical protein
MIRPFTCLCVLLAAGSGLYLYQVKHRTLMLDAQIADVLKQADAARARTAVLHAEYAALSQSQRVGDLSARFLSLKPTSPSQFVQLASLDAHLPPVEHFPAPGEIAAPPPSAAEETDADVDAEIGAAAGTASPAADAIANALTPDPRPASPAMRVPARPAAPVLADARLGADHHAALPGTRFAGMPRAQPMPMAAPRPVSSAVLATAALHPAGAPARPRVTNAEAYAVYTPPPRGSVLRGSMLGQTTGLTMAPPVPVSN